MVLDPFGGLREAWYSLNLLGCKNCMMFVTAFYPCYQMYFPLKSGTPAIKEREQHWETIGGLVLLTVHGPWPVWRAQRGLVWPKFAWLRKLHYVRHSILPLLSDVFPPEIRDHSLYRERATLENDWGASGAPCRWSLTRLGGLTEAWYCLKRLGCENCMMFVTAFYPLKNLIKKGSWRHGFVAKLG